MARCAKCNKFMLFKSQTGYCNDCYNAVLVEDKRKREEEERQRRAEEERLRKEEEARKAEEERRRKEEEARKAEEERRRKEEEARKAEEERRRKEEEARKAEEELRQKEEEDRKAEEERRRKEEEARKAEEQRQEEKTQTSNPIDDKEKTANDKDLLEKSKSVVKQYFNDEITSDDVLKQLHDGIISVNGTWRTKDDKRSFLSIAIDKGDHDLAAYLIENGCDVNGETYTMVMQSGERWKIADTPITIAIKKSDFEIADLLLSHGADFNIKNQLGPSKVHIISLVSGMGDVKQLKWLLKNGANPNQQSTVMGGMKTVPLYDAIQSRKHDNAKALIKAGANPDYVIRGDQADYTALNYTIMNDDLIGFNILMDAHANPNCVRVSHVGWGDNPALCDAISEGRYEMVERLLNSGVDTNCHISVKGRTFTPMECATINHDYRMIKLLNSHGLY